MTPNPLEPVLFEVKRTIVGQDVLLERMAIAMLAGGHLLVEGVPSYYPQFGFRSASELGFGRPDPRIPERAWMALALGAYDPSVAGPVVYPGFFPPPPDA